jgi:NADP-dependent alcohol dehydrogenase
LYKRAKIPYGGGASLNGIHEQVINKGHEIVEFSGIEANPHLRL